MERIGQRASQYSFLYATIGQALLLESGIIRRTRIWTRHVEQTWMKDIGRQGISAEAPRCWFPSAVINHLQRYYPQLQKREDLSASQQLKLLTPPSSPLPSLSYRILPWNNYRGRNSCSAGLTASFGYTRTSFGSERLSILARISTRSFRPVICREKIATSSGSPLINRREWCDVWVWWAPACNNAKSGERLQVWRRTKTCYRG